MKSGRLPDRAAEQKGNPQRENGSVMRVHRLEEMRRINSDISDS